MILLVQCSFEVVMFVVTASFTHGGMYNIAAWTSHLAAGARAAGSSYGAQVYNDLDDQGCDGPRRPVGLQPYSHQYLLTVYALGKELDMASSTHFPPYAEGLWHARGKAFEEGHVLASASIEGFHAATRPSP